MKFLLPWHKKTSYRSLLWLESKCVPGVKFSLRKVSLSQRLELSARIRKLTLQNEFLRAGELTDQMEAATADLLVQKLYVEWAVVEIDGLRIDGKTASVELLIQRGPETLVSEMTAAIRNSLELSDAERKNY
jgi:hypothetical protein